MKKRLFGLLAISALLATACGELSANAQTRAKIPNNYKTTFRNNVIKGCIDSKSTRISPSLHKRYCECYADGFMKRYDAEQLYLISNSLPKDRNELKKAVRAFMSPEVKACLLKR